MKAPRVHGLRRLARIQLRYWALGAVGWVALAATLLPEATPTRVAAVYAFTLLVPGLAFSGLIATDFAARWVLSVALSVALAIGISVVMTALRNDAMYQRIALLAAITTVAALACGLRRLPPEGAVEDQQEKSARW